MAEIIDARVKQKKDTLANWNANTMILLDGEQAFVLSGAGQPINFKIGDGTKRFSELPFWIQYDQAAFVPVTGLALPSPTQSVGYTILGEGTYTHAGGNVVVPDGHWGVANWDGSAWSFSDMGEMPTINVDGVVEENNQYAVTGGEVFDKTIKPSDLDKINASNQLLDKSKIKDGYYVSTTANGGISSGSNFKSVLVPLLSDKSQYNIQDWNTITKTVAFYKGDIPSSIDSLIGDNTNLIISDRSSNLSSLGFTSSSTSNFTKPTDATFMVITIKNGSSSSGETDEIYASLMVSPDFGAKKFEEYKPLSVKKIKEDYISAKFLIDSDENLMPSEAFINESDLSKIGASNKFIHVEPNTYVHVNTGAGKVSATDWATTTVEIPSYEPTGTLVIQNWLTATKTIAFYSSDPVTGDTSNLLFGGRLTDYTGVYELSGSNAKIIYPSGTKFIVVTIKRNADSDSIYSNLYIDFSEDYIENPDLSGEELVSKIRTNSIASKYLIDKDGGLVSVDDIVLKGGDSLNTKSEVTFVKEGETIAIRIPFDSSQDLVHRWQLKNVNGVLNSQGVYSVGKTESNSGIYSKGQAVHAFSDNIAPIFFKNLLTATGNHGVALPIGTVSSGHGKTSVDLFSVWRSGNDEFYLVEIISSTQLRFLGKERSDRTISRSIGVTLTHVSGATNTSDIVTTSRTSVEVKPSVRSDISKKFILDGVEITEDGEYHGKEIKMVEISNVPDYRKPTLVAPFDVTNAPIMIQQRITYSYDKTNTLYVDYIMDDRGNFPIAYNGFIQSGMIAVNPNLGINKNEIYFPNSNVYNGIDFRKKVDLTSPLGTDLLINNTSNEDPNKPVQRAIQISSNSGDAKYGYVHGYAYNIGKSSVEERKSLYRQWELRGTTGKSYPRVLWEQDFNYGVIHVSAYYQYFDPKLNPNATSVYVHKEEGYDYVYIDFHNNYDKTVVNLPDYVQGKSFEIVDSIGIEVLGGNNVPISGLNLSVSLINGYAYIVLKMNN